MAGTDHGFSFPFAYFEQYSILQDWPKFLDDFQQHWPTDDPNTYVDFVGDGISGQSKERMGDSQWLRLTKQWTATAKSVFLFDVQGFVAKSTHAGLRKRNTLPELSNFWCFPSKAGGSPNGLASPKPKNYVRTQSRFRRTIPGPWLIDHGGLGFQRKALSLQWEPVLTVSTYALVSEGQCRIIRCPTLKAPPSLEFVCRRVADYWHPPL